MQATEPQLPLYRPWIAGTGDTEGRATVPLVDPYRGEAVGHVEQATEDDVTEAVRRTREAAEEHLTRPRHERAAWLRDAADAVQDAVPALVELLVTSIGKPRRAAEVEARRGPSMLRMCAEEIARLGGESLPLDAVPGGEGLWSMTRREPYGVAALITPFNAPINLLLQKLAPAVATGNAVVVKPAPEAAAVTAALADLIAPCLPPGMLSVLYGGPDVVADLVSRPEVGVVSLTGGEAAGRAVLREAGIKPVRLELGSNSPNIVLADAELDFAARRIAGAAFEASGQQCISAQRIIVHEAVYEEFLETFLDAARALVVGDPADPATDIGPVIHERAAERIRSVVRETVQQGAKLALDGLRADLLLGPTVLTDAPATSRVVCEEIFGPVAAVLPVGSVEDAVAVANDVPGLLQASCFTTDLTSAMVVSESLRAGSVWINQPSRFRLDVYPFGGYGTSGIGREGVRYAMEEFSQLKHVGLRPAGPGARRG